MINIPLYLIALFSVWGITSTAIEKRQKKKKQSIIKEIIAIVLLIAMVVIEIYNYF